MTTSPLPLKVRAACAYVRTVDVAAKCVPLVIFGLIGLIFFSLVTLAFTILVGMVGIFDPKHDDILLPWGVVSGCVIVLGLIWWGLAALYRHAKKVCERR